MVTEKVAHLRSPPSFTDHPSLGGSEAAVIEKRPFRPPKVSGIRETGTKDLRLAFATQKRTRMIRLTQYLFGDFWNLVSYTDEVESEIQYF